jgi:serine/threonine protein kinase
VIGHKLLHYEIVARLGAGGMGEVWRAVDPRLQRDVAIKILPAAGGDAALLRECFVRADRWLTAQSSGPSSAGLRLERHCHRRPRAGR